MATRRTPKSPRPEPVDRGLLRDLVGYLDFSGGAPDPSFQRGLDRFLAARPAWESDEAIRDALLQGLAEVREHEPALARSAQAEAVIRLVLDRLLPAYRAHHADLLYHQPPEAFRQSFFLARLFEATLGAGGPWDEPDRIVAAGLDHVNDFLGFRPVAVLENGRKMEPYPHERFRPVPLYLRGTGVASGPYKELIEHAVAFLEQTPEEILHDSYFDLRQMEELAVDLRAHDHLHPVSKRTNYMFGEWDPHRIDLSGRYVRFVVRQIILDSLLDWMAATKGTKRDELLYDASAVLCGTMLMASAISGAGPATHDSNVTLTSLLPKVARQRDAFYARLLAQAEGPRAERLRKGAQRTQQPFGHVRQHLNMVLANYGARQVQNRHLAELYARMGFPEAGRRQALAIPSAAGRFECEIRWRLTSADRALERGDLPRGAELTREARDFLRRGISCGAIVDPWNILGFQGQFPLFSSREDSVPDQRVETLLELVERLFGLHARILCEAAAQEERTLYGTFRGEFEELADEWDRYATGTVDELPAVSGRESLESAEIVAEAISRWRAAGSAAGDVAFWRRHVDRFRSAKAYAVVVEMLLRKRDLVAARGLLVQWLGQADEVQLESGPYSFHALMLEWMDLVTGRTVGGGDRSPTDDAGAPSDAPRTAFDWTAVSKAFDFIEANAGDFWSVPSLDPDAPTGTRGEEPDDAVPEERPHASGHDDAPDWADRDDDEDDLGDDDEDLFGAAYDDVTYRDSAADGVSGDTVDGDFAHGTTEFEAVARRLEPRLRFLNTLAQLWQTAAAALAVHESPQPAVPGDDEDEAAARETSAARPAAPESRSGPETALRHEAIAHWAAHARRVQTDLVRLIDQVAAKEVAASSGDHDANVEFDLQSQAKFYVMHTIVATHASCRSAERLLRASLPASAADAELPPDESNLVALHRGLLRRDAAEIRRVLPTVLADLSRRPLLYVPFENGGDPRQILEARSLQAVIRFLLAQLPQTGLLRETWHVLRTAYRMERTSRPAGMAVTEFDRLFRTALERSLEALVRSSRHWQSGRFDGDDLLDVLAEVVERYLDQWLRHANTMRLSTVESLLQDDVWEDVRRFVADYGDELFHARMLTLGNVRTILHQGIDRFLEWLAEHDDPLHPSKLLADVEKGTLAVDHADEMIELIYGTVVDKFDRFLEYNTTTTQSDYGEMFHCLLDFLRTEAAYDREAWNLVPVALAHEVLARTDRQEAARIWEGDFRERTKRAAQKHLGRLEELERTYGMRLPSVTDHLSERFVKPLAVNRMLALVPPAVDEARRETPGHPHFDRLVREIDAYLENTSGSGIDVPPWMRQLDKAVDQTVPGPAQAAARPELELELPFVPVGLRDMRRQLRTWKDPLRKRKGR